MPYNANRDEINIIDTNPGDIRLSNWEYLDLIDPLLDDRLSAAGLMRFKRLREQMNVAMIVAPLVALPLAWYPAKWIGSFVQRGMHSTRLNCFSIILVYPIFCYWTCTAKIPRKIFTDVICDNGTDGAYVRKTLSEKKPGLWKVISKQLSNRNFNFEEMYEYNGVQFPTYYVKNKLI